MQSRRRSSESDRVNLPSNRSSALVTCLCVINKPISYSKGNVWIGIENIPSVWNRCCVSLYLHACLSTSICLVYVIVSVSSVWLCLSLYLCLSVLSNCLSVLFMSGRICPSVCSALSICRLCKCLSVSIKVCMSVYIHPSLSIQHAIHLLRLG